MKDDRTEPWSEVKKRLSLPLTRAEWKALSMGRPEVDAAPFRMPDDPIMRRINATMDALFTFHHFAIHHEHWDVENKFSEIEGRLRFIAENLGLEHE